MYKKYKSKMLEHISTFAAAKEDGTKLILATDSSLILGTPVIDGDPLDEVPIFRQIIDTASPDKIERATEEDNYLKAVFLKDVSIQSTSNQLTTNMPFLVVFVDDILGVSLGKLNSD